MHKKLLQVLVFCFTSTLGVGSLHAADGLYLGVQAGSMNHDGSGFTCHVALGPTA